MCGIIGFQGQFTVASFRAGLVSMRHRGPDDGGEFLDAATGTGLGHARLSIIDLSPLGHQPMSTEDGRFHLVFNGEIYNYRELRASLESRGHRFRGHSDTEVLLRLFAEVGTEALPQLNGIFAFAVWDAQNRSLLLARDALGVKPLYFSEVERGVAFASELKSLIQLVPEVKEIDAASLLRYASMLWCPGEGTPLKRVRKVLPGEVVEIQDGRVRRSWTWYQLPVFRGVRPDLSAVDAVAGSLGALRTAVHRQMVADVPVGAFLSGGLDSSAVVALAREVHPDIRCFSIEVVGGEEEGRTDDLPYARRVAEHLGVRLDVVQIDSARIAGDLERMVWQLDEPLADPAPLNVLYISELARQQGIKVLLSGSAGDDLFTGYRRHRAVMLDRWWMAMPRSIRVGVEAWSRSLDQRRVTGRRLERLFRGAGLGRDDRLANYFVSLPHAQVTRLFAPEVRRSMEELVPAQPLIDFLSPLPDSASSLQRMLAIEQRFFLADHNLTYTDKMSMAVGVEARVPFLDLELVEFAARIPDGLKQRGAVGKWVLKKAMEPFLPHDVIYRPKTGFGAPIRRWMVGELRPVLDGLLSTEAIRRRGLFDAEAVRALIEANAAGSVDGSYTLLSLLCIEMWCRRFLDA